MCLILSTTFLSLTPKQQEFLINEWGGIITYTPDQEAMIMSYEDWRQDIAKTLLKVEKVKKMV